MSTGNFFNGTIDTIDIGDFSKKPYKAEYYADSRGVVDWGNLLQFAPYESGYCFLAVINGPWIAQKIKTAGKIHGAKDKDGNNVYAEGSEVLYDLQEAFIKILEQEFKGLSGIENITAETMDITDGISTLSLLGKVTQTTNSTITMDFTEKSGSLITKYISTYLKYIRDPKTQAKTYGGYIKPSTAGEVCFSQEVFNFLYIITDSTCYNIEKAFLILNAQPIEAGYSDLYNMNKGDISTKEISVNFNAFVVDGKLPNKIALTYMRSLLNSGSFQKGKINVNSYDMNWSISGIDGGVLTGVENLKLQKGANGDIGISATGDGEELQNISTGDDYSTYEGLK